MEASGPSPYAVEQAVRSVAAAIAARYDVVTMRLYGSRARGDHRSDSDADLAVVLQPFDQSIHAVAGQFGSLMFDTLLETGIYVEAIPIRREHWEAPETYTNPYFIENVKRDGIDL